MAPKKEPLTYGYPNPQLFVTRLDAVWVWHHDRPRVRPMTVMSVERRAKLTCQCQLREDQFGVELFYPRFRGSYTRVS